MVVVMAIDYEWLKQHARTLYVLTVLGPARPRRRTASPAGRHAAGLRRRADPGPAGRVRQVHRAAGAVLVPQRRAQRRGQLRPLPRRADDRRPAGGADHRPARPRHGVGAHRHGDGRAARRRRQGPVHPRHQPAVAASRSARRSSAGLVNPYQLERVRVFFDENNPELRGGGVPGHQRRAGRRHRRPVRQGLAAGPADQRPGHPGDLGRLPVRRRRRAVRSRRLRARC